MAIRDNPGATPILHSDQGSQYKAKDFQKEAENLGITLSMSRPSNCLDNSPIESFFSTFKVEWYYRIIFDTFKSLEESVEYYIDFYNNKRYRYQLKCMAPADFRRKALAELKM